MVRKPTSNTIPPHICDLLAPNDGNYRRLQVEGDQHANEGNIKPDLEDAFDIFQREQFDATEGSPPPRSLHRTPATTLAVPRYTDTTGSPSSRPYTRLPPGITPHVISSSDTSHFAVHRRGGSTSVRRKSMSRHGVIAEATNATGALMATQMQEITNASRNLENSKIEVQLKLFAEQIEYQRKKDRRQYENTVIANDNARLAIVTQGEIVSCLTQLSTLLARSMSMP